MRRVESNKLLFVIEYLVAFASAVYLFTFGLFRRNHRGFIQSIGAQFGFRPREVKKELPLLPLGAVLPRDFQQSLVQPSPGNGNITFLELCVINQLARQLRPTAIFELGTFDGRTTLNLAANTPPETRLWTIDLPASALDQTAFALSGDERILVEKETSGGRFAGQPESRRITQLYGDTATFDFSPHHGQIDFVFIDASHAYDYVLNDSRVALKLLRNGRGTIIWHDYGEWVGVTGALNELRREKPFAGMQQVEGTTLVVATVEL